MVQDFHSMLQRMRLKSRAKLVYQADETEAINLPCKSRLLLICMKNSKEIMKLQTKNILYPF